MGADLGLTVSLSGAIGAAIGLYVGWIDYKILKGMLQALESKGREGGTGGAVFRFRTLIGVLIFVIPMVGFPVIGYWAGSLLAG